MVLNVIEKSFSVCKVDSLASIDATSEFVFIARTDEEISLVCETSRIPASVIAHEDGWRCFRIEGMLDFSLVGIMAKIATLLADAGISIFAVSTFNTDYFLIKAEKFDQAVHVLGSNGFIIL